MTLLSAWKSFTLAAVRNAESIQTGSALSDIPNLPKFNSIEFTRRMHQSPPADIEVARATLNLLQPLSHAMNEACAAASENRGLLVALGYVISGVAELDMCIIAAYPELEHAI